MNLFKYWKKDVPASLVVFFVALPLCLGIALASGAPLFSGVIAGIIGGVVVGLISKSNIGVSGPAAGLTAIVLTAITDLGGYEIFLVSVVMAGILQIIMGLLKAGVIGYYFPSSVIKGMLCAIGIIILLKQIPLVLGLSGEMESDRITFINFHEKISIGVIIVSVVSLLVLLLWDEVLAKRSNLFKLVPGPLIAVAIGIIIYLTMGQSGDLALNQSQLVNVPIPEDFNSFISNFTFPNFSALNNPAVYLTALTIAVVASLETLLSVEATDKLDPMKRQTPTSFELIAQGIGNTLSGLIGGLPLTQVIVRSSANVMSGGLSKLSTVLHGLLLLLSVIIIPKLLNLIPLAVLASVLLIIGYKLANPKRFVEMYKLGKEQFIPFIVTVVAIVIFDLLVGIIAGLIVGVIVLLLKSYTNSHSMLIKEFEGKKNLYHMNLAEEVTFVNRGSIVKELDALPQGAFLELDFRKTKILDYDILEYLDEFKVKAKNNNIQIKIISERGIVDDPHSFREFFGHKVFKMGH
ncbi:SulP family inorganic anion transporter [Moheibacter sediminis]|uniref:Sulfate permease, MFS superfamily n=1 Tax=Moheibacter sediminis TaxID=1434700 RepID=A0A1W2BP21_9FLAO|nr:SulP family inorganic anion transporter [Moheibacter sediminis]SMC74554.1 Sulfate permease, MFS superfamily [Moheibacter sediminis]